MITKERIAELRRLQVKGVTNDMTGLWMREVYMPVDMDIDELLDAAESAIELREAASLVVASLGSKSGRDLMHRDPSLQAFWKALRDLVQK